MATQKAPVKTAAKKATKPVATKAPAKSSPAAKKPAVNAKKRRGGGKGGIENIREAKPQP